MIELVWDLGMKCFAYDDTEHVVVEGIVKTISEHKNKGRSVTMAVTGPMGYGRDTFTVDEKRLCQFREQAETLKDSEQSWWVAYVKPQAVRNTVIAIQDVFATLDDDDDVDWRSLPQPKIMVGMFKSDDRDAIIRNAANGLGIHENNIDVVRIPKT